MALLDPATPPALTELEPVGGAGLLAPPRDGVTLRSLLDAEDQAKAFGFASQGESRFPGPDLGLERTGLALHRMPADATSAFGHRHADAEELHASPRASPGGSDATATYRGSEDAANARSRRREDRDVVLRTGQVGLLGFRVGREGCRPDSTVEVGPDGKV